MPRQGHLALLLLATAVGLCAQQPEKPYTLHVYTNRIQIPTLVLKKSRSGVPQPDTELTMSQFGITLDAGPVFHPTGMHVQGDDPINLAVLLDLGPEGVTAGVIGDHLEALARQMKPQDRFSLYAFHCSMKATADSVPATAEAIRAAVKDAFAAQLGPPPGQEPCDSQQVFWDSVQKAMLQLEPMRGRNTLLLFSNAALHHNNAHSLTHVAGRARVTVLAIRNTELFKKADLTQVYRGYYGAIRFTEDPLHDLCAVTGGYLFSTGPGEFETTIQAILPDLRSRYILEFPRPDQFTQENHTVVVTLPSARHDIALPAGTVAQVDMTDPNDPSVVRGPPSPAVFGSRRPIDPETLGTRTLAPQ